MTQRIENSDRGVTLNKSLAWTMAVGLITASLFTGIQMASVTSKLDEVSRIGDRAAHDRRQIEIRVRSLEQSKARDDERFTSILTFMSKIDSRLERIENNRP